MYRSILSLSKMAYQIWQDHPFSQRNRATERTVGVRIGGDREVGVGVLGEVGQNLKNEG